MYKTVVVTVVTYFLSTTALRLKKQVIELHIWQNGAFALVTIFPVRFSFIVNHHKGCSVKN